MKILYIYDRFPTTYQSYLIEILSLLKKSLGVKSLVYEKSDEADYSFVSYSFQDQLQRVFYKLKLSKYISSDIRLMADYDIIHIQHSYLWRKILPFKNLPKRPKIIITLRGGDTFMKPWLDSSWKNLYKDKNHLIDAFVVMSQNQKEYLMKWGVNENKIYVIPISFGLFSEAKPKYPNPDKLKLVSAFRMTWEKNIEGSIRFARILKDKEIDFQYDIYGDGKDLGELYYLIDRYDLGNYLFIKGKIDNKELKKKLPSYDFFVQLSISESLGMSVIEAQSQGVPCIVSNSGGLPEAVDNGKLGVISDYNNYEYFVNETIKLWKNREMYFSLSKNAINYVNEQFSTEIEIEKLISLYEKMS